jgi:hypothetical protein
MATHQGRRGARARKGGGSEGLGAGVSKVKRPSVPDVLIGVLPFVSTICSFVKVKLEDIKLTIYVKCMKYSNYSWAILC